MNLAGWAARLEQRIEAGKKIANKKTIQLAAKKSKMFAKYAAKEFYSSYDPLFYGRTNDFYNRLFIIEPKEEEIFVKASSAGLWGHRVSGDYILEVVANQGYHGGAISGPSDFHGNSHPAPGTPYWRKPATEYDGIPPYSLWGRPAEKTESPIEIFMRYFRAAEKGTFSDCWNKTFLKYVYTKNFQDFLKIKIEL